MVWVQYVRCIMLITVSRLIYVYTQRWLLVAHRTWTVLSWVNVFCPTLRGLSQSLYLISWLPLLLPPLSPQPLEVAIHVNIGHCNPFKASVQCVISNLVILVRTGWFLQYVSVFLLCFWVFTFKMRVKLIFSSFACLSHDRMCFRSCNGHYNATSSSSNPPFICCSLCGEEDTGQTLTPAVPERAFMLRC